MIQAESSQRKPMRVLILADGDPPSPALAQRVAREADLFLAADGAAHKAVTLGVTPDIICGDFDSVRLEEIHATFPHIEVVPTPNQDAADLEKAVLLALARGATQIAILGATGGRMDHTLTSFALLARYAEAVRLRLLDNVSAMWALTEGEDCAFAATPGETVSLITFTGVTVSIAGVRWPLDDFPLQPGTLGVSNVAAETTVQVRARNGGVFVVHLTPQPVAFDALESDSVRQT